MIHKKPFRTDLIYFGCTNKYGVIFDESDLDPTVFNSYRIFGELGHPDCLDVNLSHISHTIENIKMENGILYGDIKILNTPRGNQLDALFDAQLMIFRPRITFERATDGTKKLYKIHTFDAISKSDDCFNLFRREKILKIVNKLKIRNL